MSLFDLPFETRSTGRNRKIGRVLLSLGAIGLVLLAVLPSPYVIERPGAVFNTLGKLNGKSMIEVTGKAYPAQGKLNMVTISLVGSPEGTPSWGEVLMAWLDPKQVILPLETVYPSDTTFKQSQEQNQAMMVDSQQDAVAAALRGMGRAVPALAYVSEVYSGTPAKGKLLANDVILAVDGKSIDSVESLRSAIAAGKGKALDLAIERAGKSQTLQIKPYLDGDAYRLGILAAIRYDFPVKVKINSGEIGGPSAGLMFALGITDLLTPGELTAGHNVAGTGTIDAQGNVGAIGGVRQKMYAAQSAGSKYFFAPASNCAEVAGNEPEGLRVVRVATLAQAKSALSRIAAGAPDSELPTCTK